MAQQNADSIILQTYKSLPEQLQNEAWDFIQFLVNKAKKTKPKTSLTEKKQLTKRQFGYFPKGTFEMSDDFDAPLDCFKEYRL